VSLYWRETQPQTLENSLNSEISQKSFSSSRFCTRHAITEEGSRHRNQLWFTWPCFVPGIPDTKRYCILRILKRSMIIQKLEKRWNGDTERDDNIKHTQRCGRTDSRVTRQNRVNTCEERCEDFKLLRCLIRPNLRHKNHRSFLFSRLDLLNRTDPDETVRNADYIMHSTFLSSSSGSVLFIRSNLLKRKDLCFSWLRLGLIRHRKDPHTCLLKFATIRIVSLLRSWYFS
jgi:hypothetical protein